MWGNYTKLTDDLTHGLKDAEDRARALALPTDLTQVTNRLAEVELFSAQVSSLEPKLAKISKVSTELTELSPESRTAQTASQLKHRYQALTKVMESQLEHMNELEKNVGTYNGIMATAGKWIDEEEKNLASLETLFKDGAKPTGAYQDKLEKLKGVLEAKEGQIHLKQAADAGEMIIPGVGTESKELVRKKVRELRDRVSHHLESGNFLLKKIESVQLNVSTFEEPFQQVLLWFEGVKQKAVAVEELQPTLSDKRGVLNASKNLQLDISSHADIVSVLSDKVKQIPDRDAASKFAEFSKDYMKMKSAVDGSVESLKSSTASHEKFEGTFDAFSDWLKQLQTQLKSVTQGHISDKAGAIERIEIVNQLLHNENTGNSKLGECEELLNVVHKQTRPDGQQALKESFKRGADSWKDFLKSCNATKMELTKKLDRIQGCEAEIERATDWLQRKEYQVREKCCFIFHILHFQK
jgi:hypothetical protein